MFKSKINRLATLLLAVFFCFLVPFLSSRVCAEGAVYCFGRSPASLPVVKSSKIDYSLNLASERYFVYVPKGYDGKRPFGLVVYISSGDSFQDLPLGWNEVFDKHHLFFIAPQLAGNGHAQSRRTGLAVLGALAMMSRYQIDRSQIYAAGLSGGARTACDLGFLQPDLFSGTIQDCGANFYRSVPKYYAKNSVDTNGHPYGVTEVPEPTIGDARSRVRFVLITGSNDFRRGNVADIYYYGFKQEGFKAKFMDVSGMGHEDCSAATLEEALKFIRNGK